MGGVPTVTGEKVAEYTSYEAAQKAVSTLIAADVPAREIAIVGDNLRSIETVTGRLGYAAAARTGAINGILFGLILSLVFVFGTPDAAIQLFLGVMLVGVALGMLMSLITYALLRRRRDYASVTQVVAERYEVTVHAGSIHRARGALGVAERPAPAAPAVVDDAPPRYGERIDPTATPTGERPAPGPSTPTPAAPAPAAGPAAPATGSPAASPVAPGPDGAPSGDPAPGPDLPDQPAR